jgi:hypothetical protein
LGALGGTANGSTSFEILNLIAPISGSAALMVPGSNISAGADTGVVKVSDLRQSRRLEIAGTAQSGLWFRYPIGFACATVRLRRHELLK